MVRSNRSRGRTEHEEGGAAAAGTPADGGVGYREVLICQNCYQMVFYSDRMRHDCAKIEGTDWHGRETAIARD